MTIDTYELRWFFQRPLELFRTATGDSVERTDYYAPLASDRSNVKLRNECLEVKRLLDVTEIGKWPIQRWSKTILSLGDSPLLAQAPVDWLAVAKRRQTREVVVDVCESPKDWRIQVEWTEIRALSFRSWSFALEAPAELGPRCVVDMLQAQLGSDALSELPRTNTSYAQWLLHAIVKL